MRKIWQKIPNPLAKFLAFMLIWTILANLYIFLNPPNQIPIEKPYQKELFNICVIKDGKPSFSVLNGLPANSQFCQQPIEHIQGLNEFSYGHLDKLDNEWQLTRYGDSMADPFVYRYRIENNQVIPLWYSYNGGFVLHFTAWLFALFATTIIHAILNRIIQRKNRQKAIT